MLEFTCSLIDRTILIRMAVKYRNLQMRFAAVFGICFFVVYFWSPTTRFSPYPLPNIGVAAGWNIIKLVQWFDKSSSDTSLPSMKIT